MKPFDAIICLILVLLFSPILAHKNLDQTRKVLREDSPVSHFEKKQENMPVRNVTHGMGSFFYTIKDGEIIDSISIDVNDEISVIIQLEDEPLARLIGNGKRNDNLAYAEHKKRLEEKHDLFIETLELLEGRFNEERGLGLKEVRHKPGRRFIVVFNGLELKTRRWMIPHLKSIRGVKDVEINKKVRATLDYSVSHIGADLIWAEYGITGEGITVGILDTGIDYLHPDLGGGIGPDYKVIGGYDFINDDDDPMDDHGHGTHVAGIVAADGNIIGVAYQAQLMAYKVLAACGSGSWEGIIAALEQAVLDEVHIVNLSLGGDGHADDFLSLSVDNTVAAGVVCVIAAGNSGPGYGTIDSPGTARQAITVGAADTSDEIAFFSSRGPSEKISGIKPDLLAPGVSITAPTPQGNYASWDGTSMAAPHVAGVAALLMQYRPELTTSQVKSRLMQSAVDVGYDPFIQGSGRVSSMNAFQDPCFLIEPASISFGMADNVVDVWTSTKTINISNFADVPKNIDITLGGNFPQGVNIAIYPQSTTIDPDDSEELTIAISVDNQLVPITPDELPAYFDALTFSTDSYDATVPLAFQKKPSVTLVFDEAPLNIVVFRRVGGFYRHSQFFPGNEISIPLPGVGEYDVFAAYSDSKSYLIREAIPVSGAEVIEINRAEVKNHFQLHTIDQNGDVITPSTGMDHLMTWTDEGNAWGRVGVFLGDENYPQDYFFTERYFSDFSLYSWAWNGFNASDNSKEYYVFGSSVSECYDDFSFYFEPVDFIEYEFNYLNLPENEDVFALPSLVEFVFGQEDSEIGALHYPHSNTFIISPHFGGQGGQSFFIRLVSYEDCDLLNITENLHYTSAPFVFQQNKPMSISTTFYDIGSELWNLELLDYFENVINLGIGPSFWNGLLWHSYGSTMVSLLNHQFLYQFKEHAKTDAIHYRIYNQGQLFQEGNLMEDFPIYCSYEGSIWINFPAGECMFELDSPDYTINDRVGKATMRTTFNSLSPNLTGYSPGISFFQILENNIANDVLETGNENKVRFKLKTTSYTNDKMAVDVALAYRHEEDSVWHQLPLELGQGVYEAPLPDSLITGYYHLKMSVTDYKEQLEYKMNPAFFIHELILPPLVYNLTGGGTFCEGSDPSGIHATLEGSQLNTSYILVKNGEACGDTIQGTGFPLVWMDLMPGNYMVTAINAAGSIAMSGHISVVMVPCHTITAFAGSGGTISPTGTVTVNQGESQIFTIVPDGGYEIADILVDGVSIGAVESYSFSNVTANHTINAFFSPLTNILHLAKDDDVTIVGEVCFFSPISIWVAGFGFDFFVEPGADVTLVAAESIRLLPGTKVAAGAWLHAHTAVDGEEYCLQAKLAETDDPSLFGGDAVSDRYIRALKHNNDFFRVYPNPTAGTFTLELVGTGNDANISVDIFQMTGQRVVSQTLPSQGLHPLSLEGHQPGIYFIRVITEKQIGMERLIKR